jgi:prepilin-type N-terminal cleavage/methylation domain-containing protein
MLKHTEKLPDESGFTLIELLVVIVIMALLFVLSTINLGHAQSGASVTSETDTLLADLKSQQLLAMSGEIGSTTSQQPHGIYFQSSSYTLFADSTYSTSDSDNFSINVAPNTITTTFPSNQVLFEVGDGAISGYNASDDTITISGTGKSQTITLNRFGATSTL